jgi:septal ring factor EnvC (AmiA/AmiB activator)
MLKKIFFTLLLVLVSIFSANAQTIKELEAQKKKAQEKLALTQKLLDETKKSKKGTQNEIQLLTRSIEQTNQLIFSINSEIDGLNRDIENLQTEKTNLNGRLENMKREYAKMISKSEIYRKQFSPALFIFSSKSFAQGYRRMRYLKEMADYQKKQSLEINDLTKNLAEKENLLQTYIVQKSQSLQEKEKETEQLNQQKVKKDKILKDYNAQEKDLQRTIQQEQQRTKQLNALIKKKVEAENRRKAELAQKAAEEAKRRKAAKSTTAKKTEEKPVISEAEFKAYKEDLLLTGNFEKNRGRLPMPVESGNIYRHFGMQINPFTKAAENNLGIYIAAPGGSDARAVFDGSVFEIVLEPGSGYCVWVMHGNYTTVYAQLSVCYVKKGDKIKAKQKIGKIAVKNNNTEMNFYILNKNASYENPENWLNN